MSGSRNAALHVEMFCWISNKSRCSAESKLLVLFKEASKCKETREDLLFLAKDKRRNSLPYLAKLKQGPRARTQAEMCFLSDCLRDFSGCKLFGCDTWYKIFNWLSKILQFCPIILRLIYQRTEMDQFSPCLNYAFPSRFSDKSLPDRDWAASPRGNKTISVKISGWKAFT